MTKKTTEIPKSRAKTAYGLLSEIRALILEEPLRYNQSWWLSRRGQIDKDFEWQPNSYPSCGTVGCVAGWVATLKSPNKFDALRASVIAQNVLGLDDEQEYELFNEEAASGAPQSLEHAKAGARHIRRFQKKYRAQLLAKKV